MLTLQALIAGLPIAKILENDAKFHVASLPVEGTAAASATTPVSYTIPPKGNFLCLSVTGRFTTIESGAADDETCKLSIKLRSGSGRVYIPDFMDLDLWLTPGRVKGSVAAGDNGNQLQFPGFPWVTIYRGGDTLTHEIQNESAAANSWAIAYHGIWLLQ
jgi:hypothetical protein